MRYLNKSIKTLLGGGIILLLIFTFVGQAAAQTCTTAPAGMISWWDGDAVDLTTKTASDIQDANDGVLVNGATTDSGFVGDAFSFDNVDDYIDFPTTGFSTTAMTIDLWFNPTTWAGHDDIVQHSTDGFNQNRISLERGNFFGGCVPGELSFLTGNAVSSLSVLCTTTIFTVGTWYHIAATFDSSGNTSIYVNGVLEDSASSAFVPSVIDSSFLVGHPWDNDLSRFFHGLIDEVEIYDRVLTAAEINAIFLAGTAGKCKDAGDSDGDGITDDVDLCPGTVIPESVVPTRRLGVNRFALVDGDGTFDTTPPKGKGPNKSFTIDDTAGCSCEQIIDELGLGQGHTKFGCSISAMEDWISLLN